MKGTPEEELGKGSLHKYETLKLIHKLVKPKKYLEIGVQKGRSLALANCVSVGIDPKPRISFKTDAIIYKMTSDEFFNKHTFQPDLVFIDGSHLFEQALRDFINCEKICHKDSVIVMDDIFPVHPSQALRKRRTQKWAGDVWKVYEILKEFRQDLILQPLDINPTGFLLISNVNPENTWFFNDYESIVARYMNLFVPDSILNREGVYYGI